MNKQEVFDKVYDHFITQGNPRSVEEGGKGCLYRGPDGARCAVGLLIPDDLYEPEMDVTGDVRGLLADFPQLGRVLGVKSQDDTDFLQALQSAHDEVDYVPIEDGLRTVAQTYRLAVPA